MSQSLIEQAAKRPSMLPRKALKPSMSTSQPLAFNVIPSLDAIIENSPEKKPVRDALSAASLNRQRGFGAPSRMFLGGGMKARADGIFSRPALNPHVYSSTASGANGIKLSREFFKSEQPIQTKGIQEQENQGKSTTENTHDDDDASVDTSITSIATHQSSSSNSSVTTSNGETHPPQFSGNISIDTQDRLLKLQNMLTRMNRSENASGDASRRSRYKEYEVPLKDEQNSHAGSHATTTTTSLSTRTRRRSSSVPLNYAEDNLSRSTSRAHQSSARSQAAKAAGPSGPRRVSNILPSVRPDVEAAAGLPRTGRVAGLSASVSASDSNPTPAAVTRAEKLKKPPAPLKDVVAFVDVRTAEGDDAGKIFVEMLKGLGAKVCCFPFT
jgi:hypothetical protein